MDASSNGKAINVEQKSLEDNADCYERKVGTMENGTFSEDNFDQNSSAVECAVCLQSASFPVQLPCSHIFCFLCVKGAANRNKRCALCRQEIPMEYFNDPKLLCVDEVKKKSMMTFDEGYQWFYEGRSGWWQYDDRTSQELENQYKSGDKIFELLIAGYLYVIDLESMRQYRSNDKGLKRRIRRDLRNIPDVKGIAGLKYCHSEIVRLIGDGGETSWLFLNGPMAVSSSSFTSNCPSPPAFGDGQLGQADDGYIGPSVPNNTPQIPMTPADSQPSSLSGSQEDLNIHMYNLNINGHRTNTSSPDNVTQEENVCCLNCPPAECSDSNYHSPSRSASFNRDPFNRDHDGSDDDYGTSV